MLERAMQNIKGMADVNSVIGKAVRIDGDTIVIPIAKVSYGFGGGGSDMVSKVNSSEKNFAGGIGGGATVNAEAFLVVSGGNVRVVPVNANASSVDRIIDLVPGMVDKVNGFIDKRKGGNPVPEPEMADE